MHETRGPRPPCAGGETEAQSMANDGPPARETQADGFPFPLYLALRCKRSPGAAGRSRGDLWASHRPSLSFCLLVCEMGIVIHPSGVAVRIKRDNVCKALAHTGSQPLRKTQLSGLPLVTVRGLGH